MIRDNGPGILFLPVKMMKEVKGVAKDQCMPLNKAAVLHQASDAAVSGKKAVTVLTYLHGVKGVANSSKRAHSRWIRRRFGRTAQFEAFRLGNHSHVIERTHKLVILDESTKVGCWCQYQRDHQRELLL